MGLATVPLGELYAPAIDAIIDAGGDIQLGVSAKAITFDGKRVTGVVTDDGMIESAAVISTVPFDRLDKLASSTMQRVDRRLQGLDKFDVSPILGVHLWFDREIMKLPHLVVVNRGVQWLFNKGLDDQGRQHVHAVISGADDWMDLDEDEIVRRVVADVHHALPGAVGLQPIEARSIKEKRATFAAVPGLDSIRPSAGPGFAGSSGGGIENLFLAGDWTDTGWPATMEGAVRSGYAAAAAAVGDRSGGLVEDVPTGALARLMGLR
jgi:zeta-carotene desaturase